MKYTIQQLADVMSCLLADDDITGLAEIKRQAEALLTASESIPDSPVATRTGESAG